MMGRIRPGHSAVDRRSFWLQAWKDRHLNGVFAAQKHCYGELQQLRLNVKDFEDFAAHDGLQLITASR
jgi:hypothetical protein